MQPNRRHVIAAACAFALAGTSLASSASDYPSRPIEIIVPVAAGGGTDMVGRAFAEAAMGPLYDELDGLGGHAPSVWRPHP